MDADPLEYDRPLLTVPPSYEHCAESNAGLKADFEASPLAMAVLFDWDDEEDD